MIAVTINFNSTAKITDDQFYQLCRENPEVKFERNAKGEIIIMPPTGGETGNYNFEIATDLGIWNRQTKLGICFDSSTCFKLPSGANRSPDVSWIKKERWEALVRSLYHLLITNSQYFYKKLLGGNTYRHTNNKTQC